MGESFQAHGRAPGHAQPVRGSPDGGGGPQQAADALDDCQVLLGARTRAPAQHARQRLHDGAEVGVQQLRLLLVAAQLRAVLASVVLDKCGQAAASGSVACPAAIS